MDSTTLGIYIVVDTKVIGGSDDYTWLSLGHVVFGPIKTIANMKPDHSKKYLPLYKYDKTFQNTTYFQQWLLPNMVELIYTSKLIQSLYE